jgi:DNA-directed RNA polymerase sigma subunit (sigma70/sigma32)
MRFGLDNEPPKNLADVGERLGLPMERVEQLESEALAILSEELTEE